MTTQLEPNDPRHGTIHAYKNLECRCDLCQESNRVHARRLKGLPPTEPGQDRTIWREPEACPGCRLPPKFVTRQRGFADGYEGARPTETSPDYTLGFREGQSSRALLLEVQASKRRPSDTSFVRANRRRSLEAVRVLA